MDNRGWSASRAAIEGQYDLRWLGYCPFHQAPLDDTFGYPVCPVDELCPGVATFQATMQQSRDVVYNYAQKLGVPLSGLYGFGKWMILR